MKNVRPTYDGVLVKRCDALEKTKGGIYLPPVSAEKPTEGIVIAVGPGKLLENGKIRPMEIRVGDKVLFGKYTGVDIQVDGEDGYIIMQDENILAIIE